MATINGRSGPVLSLASAAPLGALLSLSVLTACGDSSTAQVRLHASPETPGEMDAMTVWLREGDRSVRFTRPKQAPPGSGGWETPVTDVGSQGTLTVVVEATDDSVRRNLQAHVRIDLRESFRWTVDVFRRADNPAEGCFGCMGVDSTPLPDVLQNEPGEMLWITWGGQKKGSDVVY